MGSFNQCVARIAVSAFAVVLLGAGCGGGSDAAPATAAVDAPDGSAAATVEPDASASVDAGPALLITENGPTLKATTTGADDTVLGPVELGGAKYTLTIPAVAVAGGIEVTMTPVTLQGSALPVLGALKFGPSGTTFRVPAVLTVEGLADGAKASALLADDGTNVALTFVQQTKGVARVPVPHFSVASIVDAANADAEVGAAGIVSLPRANAAPLLADAFNTTVSPAVVTAGDSIAAFATGSRLLTEWTAAVQARNLDGIASPALGGKTFGAVGDDTLAKLVAAGQKVLLDLTSPTCKDGTGQLSHPNDWFGALAWITSQTALLGGKDAVPNDYAPCLTIALDPAVLSQGGTIPITQRALPLSVGLVATTPKGITAPMRGTYELEAIGATAPDFVQPPSSALFPVDVDRGADCELRSVGKVSVKITGALAGTLGLANLLIQPVVSPPLTWTVTGDVASCPTPPPIVFGAREVKTIVQGFTRHRVGVAAPEAPTTTVAYETRVDDTFLRASLPLSLFKSFTLGLSDSKAYAIPGDTGSFAASAFSDSDTMNVDGTGTFTGGTFAGRTSCKLDYDRPAVNSCAEFTAQPTACADANTTSVYDYDLGFFLRESRRLILTGSMTATGAQSGGDGGASSSVRVELRGSSFANVVVGALSGGETNGATRTQSYSYEVVLQPGGYQLDVTSRSGCTDQNNSLRQGTRLHPASVSVSIGFAAP